jgi:MFS family permease
MKNLDHARSSGENHGMKSKRIDRASWKAVFKGNIFAFGLVSFLTDLSSEMIYPLLPVFFSGLVPHAAIAFYIGLMESLAESTSSLLKYYAGHLSDRRARRKPLALAGYAVSSFIRPLTALAAAGWQVVVLRLGDRVGKGVRTAPRDALLSESAPPGALGRAFSFHRLMDHAGAVAGPLLAVLLLHLMPGRALLWHRGIESAGPAEMTAMRWLFAAAAVPGLAATLSLGLLVREESGGGGRRMAIHHRPLRRPSGLPSRFYLFLLAVALFTLGNSSDLFLIFYAQDRFSLGLGWVISLWVGLHGSKIIFSLPGGWIADRWGRRAAILAGWSVYAAVYAAMPFTSDFMAVMTLLFLYGAYYGMTEGAERALVADFAAVEDRGKAYGWYHATIGWATVPASLVFGVFWTRLGPKAAFLVGASLATGALLLLAWCLRRPQE